MRQAEEEYQKKRDDVLDKLEQRLTSSGYNKKKYPANNQSGIHQNTLVSDAKSAGVDKMFIEEYQNARNVYAQVYKEAEKKYTQDKSSSGPKSTSSRMPWNYPEVEAAQRRIDDIEELLVQALYQDDSLPTYYKKK